MIRKLVDVVVRLVEGNLEPGFSVQLCISLSSGVESMQMSEYDLALIRFILNLISSS
jgi:hypothetical protein